MFFYVCVSACFACLPVWTVTIYGGHCENRPFTWKHPTVKRCLDENCEAEVDYTTEQMDWPSVLILPILVARSHLALSPVLSTKTLFLISRIIRTLQCLLLSGIAQLLLLL